jgi:hypothetical protein
VIWSRCPACGVEASADRQTCPDGCKEAELYPSLPPTPARLWLIERRNDELRFFPPNHFRPPKRKRINNAS